MKATLRGEVRPTTSRPARCSSKAAPYAVLLDAEDSTIRRAPIALLSTSQSASMNDVKQRAEEHLQVLPPGLVGRVAGGEGVGVVRRGQGGAVGAGLAESAGVHPARPHHEMAARREVAVDAATGVQAVHPGLHDLREAPERHDPPAGFGGEELPVAERVARAPRR